MPAPVSWRRCPESVLGIPAGRATPVAWQPASPTRNPWEASGRGCIPVGYKRQVVVIIFLLSFKYVVATEMFH